MAVLLLELLEQVSTVSKTAAAAEVRIELKAAADSCCMTLSLVPFLLLLLLGIAVELLLLVAVDIFRLNWCVI